MIIEAIVFEVLGKDGTVWSVEMEHHPGPAPWDDATFVWHAVATTQAGGRHWSAWALSGVLHVVLRHRTFEPDEALEVIVAEYRRRFDEVLPQKDPKIVIEQGEYERAVTSGATPMSRVVRELDVLLFLLAIRIPQLREFAREGGAEVDLALPSAETWMLESVVLRDVDPQLRQFHEDYERVRSLGRIDPTRASEVALRLQRLARLGMVAQASIRASDSGAPVQSATVPTTRPAASGNTTPASSQPARKSRRIGLVLGGTTVNAEELRAPLSVLFGTELRVSRAAYGTSIQYDAVDIEGDHLVDLAESGQLDGVVVTAHGEMVWGVLLDGEAIFERVPHVMFDRRPVIDVANDVLEQALEDVDVLIVTATPIERQAVLAALRPLPGRDALLEGALDIATYRVGQFGRYFAAHVECAMGGEGRHGAALTLSDALREVDPKATIVVGIAFGVNRVKQRLGDVIVAESVVPYDKEKVEDVRVVPRGQPLPCGLVLSERFRTRREGWVMPIGPRQVQVHQGPILSGEKLVNSRAFRDALVARFPDAVGGEMEGSGAYAAANRGNKEIVLVKGICDWADGLKSDTAQPFAAGAAVSLCEHILSKADVLKKLGGRDRGLAGAAPAGPTRTVAIVPERKAALDAHEAKALLRLDPLVATVIDELELYIRTLGDDAGKSTKMDRRSVFARLEQPVNDLEKAWRDEEMAISDKAVAAAHRKAGFKAGYQKLQHFERVRAEQRGAGRKEAEEEAHVSMDATVKDMHTAAVELKDAIRTAFRGD